MHQTGLAHTRFSHQGDHLALPGLRLGQGLMQRRQLVLPPHKGGEPPRGGDLQAPAQMTGTRSSNTSTGSSRPFTGTGPRAVTWTRPSTSRRVAALRRMVPGVAVCSMRAASTVVSPTAE